MKKFSLWTLLFCLTTPIISACSGSSKVDIAQNELNNGNNDPNSQTPPTSSPTAPPNSETPINSSSEANSQTTNNENFDDLKFFEEPEDDPDAYSDLKKTGTSSKTKYKSDKFSFISLNEQGSGKNMKFLDAAMDGNIVNRIKHFIDRAEDKRLFNSTHAGMNITQSAIANAVRVNLNIDNKTGVPKDLDHFVREINQFLPNNKRITNNEKSKIAKVTIVPASQKRKFKLFKNNDDVELIKDSYQTPYTQSNLKVRIFAKDNQTFFNNKTTVLDISGPVNIRLTDYFKINPSQLEINDLILIPSFDNIQEAVDNKDATLLQHLNNVFSLETSEGVLNKENRAGFTSTKFINWNLIEQDGKYVPKWVPQSEDGSLVKNVASWLAKNHLKIGYRGQFTNSQAQSFSYIFKNSHNFIFNPFRERAMRDAVEKVTFTLSTKPKPQTEQLNYEKLNEIRNKHINPIFRDNNQTWWYYDLYVNMKVDLIHYWSWNPEKYEKNIKSHTFEDLHIYLLFNDEKAPKKANSSISDLFKRKK